MLCGDEAAAQRVERRCHTLLREHRKRGEWFECPVDVAWAIVEAEYPGASTRLTHWYDIDLDTMTLVPPRLGAWQGINDDIHHYRAFKEHGVLEGRFGDLGETSPVPVGVPAPA